MSKTKSALNPNNWPFAIKWLPQPAYLVGGIVRDTLIGRQSDHLDLDFIMPTKAVATARKIAGYYHAGFVLLDRERQIARVVFPKATVDFAQIEGGDLEIDLQRRDFTINAIAYDPFSQTFIDPLNGQKDLHNKIITMIKPQNFIDDPLRLLRGYRQASQLGLTIAPETLTTMRELAPLLTQIAAERIRTELGYLLHSDDGLNWLEIAWQDGLLKPYFPSADQHLEQLRKIDESGQILIKLYPQLKPQLSRFVKDTVKTSLLALARLFCLVNTDRTKAEKELQKLKYSNAEIKVILAILRYLPQLLEAGETMTIRSQFFLFQDLGVNFPSLAVVAHSYGVPLSTLKLFIDKYFDQSNKIAHPTPILKGDDLIEHLNITPNSQMGKILLEIAIAQAEAKISTKPEALDLATKILSELE